MAYHPISHRSPRNRYPCNKIIGMLQRLAGWASAAWLVLPLAVAAQGQPSKPLIRVGGDNNYPPYEFLDETGEPTGYNVELTRAIAEVMGLRVEIRLDDWSKIRHQLDSGRIDIVQGMVERPERSDRYAFSAPHSMVTASLFARRGDPAVDGIDALSGHSVLVQRDGSIDDALSANHPDIKLIPVATHGEALRALAAGRHDYALVSNLPGLYLSKELGLSNLVPIDLSYPAQKYTYAVVKGNEALLAQFSEGLAILKNTGRQQALYDKWLGALAPHKPDWALFGYLAAGILLPVALALLVILAWNRTLKRQVDRRTAQLAEQHHQLLQADKMASLGVLVSGVGHEINNPNGLLLLNLPVIRDAFQDIEPILEAHFHEQGDFPVGGLSYSRMREELPAMLEETLGSARRIKRIVEDLRDFAREGRSDRRERVNLNEVAGTAIRLLDNTIGKSTHAFRFDPEERLPITLGNRQRIEQVIINLILNACQALSSPQQAVSVTTRSDLQRNLLSVSVRDQGGGIAAEHLSRLTDPFFTTKRQCGGTGLGLSVSAQIVRDHGGQLDFHSQPDQGTEVVLTLPLVNPSEKT